MVRGRRRYGIGDIVRLWAARLAAVLVHDPSVLRGPVLAAFSADQSGLRIVSRAEGAVVGDGNPDPTNWRLHIVSASEGQAA